MRTIASLLIGSLLLLAVQARAHHVIWDENPNGTQPGNPIIMVFSEKEWVVVVWPEKDEPCEVFVTLNQPSSDLVEAWVDGANPFLIVFIKIGALRAPIGASENATITGTWQATGQPPMMNCTASGNISIPVVVGSGTGAEFPNATEVNDPISTWTGEVTADVVDLSLGGPLPLLFARAYGSQMNASGITSALGSNWMHNFDASLTIFSISATVRLYPGKSVSFDKSSGNWMLAGTNASNDQLVEVGGNFDYVSSADGLIYRFSGAGKLASIRDRNGNTLTVTQGAAGPTLVADGLGRTLTFGYTANRLTMVTDQSGRSVSFAHTGDNLTAATDANGKVTTYSYGAGPLAAHLVAAQRPMGNTPWTQQFDASGRATTQTDSFGKNTTIAFDQPIPGARIITDPLGGAEVHLYDGPGDLSQLTDAAGESTLYDYDANSRRTRVTDRLGNETDVAYDPASGFVAGVLDALGHTTTFSYAPQAQGLYGFFNLTGIQYADGSSIALTYDANGNVTGVTDQAGKLFASTFNARGQVLTATNPAGGVVSFAYNGDGTVAAITDTSGGVTTYTYDNRKRVSRVSFADGTWRDFTYDAIGRLLTRTDERGGVFQFATDDNGNLTSVTDALNQTASLSYDTDDLVTSVTDPSGQTTSYQYDPLGSVTAVTNAAAETASFTYDALRRLTNAKDPSGQGPSFSYDKEGRLASAADALGNTQTFTTDSLGRLVQQMTPLGEAFSRTFDALGRLATTTDALARSASFSYDSRGLLTGVNAPGGIGAAYGRSDLGLLSGITDPNGQLWARTHDAAGRLLMDTDPLGRSTSYTYDARGRVQSFASQAGSLQVTRDAAGNVTRRQYSDGLDLLTTFDLNNQPTGGTGVVLSYDVNGRIASSNGLVINRDVVGRIASIDYAPGKTVTYAYNARGLLASVSDWAGGSVTFTYDAAARVTSIARANGVTTQINYDANSRIGTITEANGATTLASIALQRDVLGRVTSADRTQPQEPAPALGALAQSFDAAAQLAGASYDGLGRITQDAQRTYGWDLASRLTSFTSPGASAFFGYDAFGMRTSRLPAGGSTEGHVLNYALGLPAIAIVTSAGVDQRYYIHRPDGSLLYAIDAAGNAHHYYHFDEVGSTVLLTGDGGTVTDSYGITPYGETVTAMGSTPNPFTWLGRWGVMQEGSTGLYYMRARYYDSMSARFLSRDPIRQLGPREINPYQYASGDPLSRIDPSGLKAQGVGNRVRVVALGPNGHIAAANTSPNDLLYAEVFPYLGPPGSGNNFNRQSTVTEFVPDLLSGSWFRDIPTGARPGAGSEPRRNRWGDYSDLHLDPLPSFDNFMDSFQLFDESSPLEIPMAFQRARASLEDQVRQGFSASYASQFQFGIRPRWADQCNSQDVLHGTAGYQPVFGHTAPAPIVPIVLDTPPPLVLDLLPPGSPDSVILFNIQSVFDQQRCGR